MILFYRYFIILIERKREREKERGENINIKVSFETLKVVTLSSSIRSVHILLSFITLAK